MATKAEVLAFLWRFKTCVMAEQWHVRHREKNRQALLDLQMNCEERREVLLSLQPEDYVAGPMPDHTDPGGKEVWEFGKAVGQTNIYVKLRVTEDPRAAGQHRAMVWSFHEAERRLRYPLKGGGT